MASPQRVFTVREGLANVALEPEQDGLSRAGSRALVYSQVAVEMLRRQLFHQVGEELARAILAQAGRHAGFNDAQLVLQERSFSRIDETLEAQYALLAASGFGRFDVVDLAIQAAQREAYLRARCFHSSEAESHRRLFGSGTAPACCHLVGYMAGWTSSILGFPVLTVESLCAAKGDAHCEFETLPYADFVGPEAAFWKKAFETTSSSLAQQLEEQLAMTQEQMATISRQREDIAKLSSPVLQVSDGLLVLPVIGAVDAERAATLGETLLEEIVRRRASGVIVDLTGIAGIDATTAGHFMRMIGAIRLVGAQAILTGISPAMSQVLASQGIELTGVATLRSLQEGIRHHRRREEHERRAHRGD